MSSISSEFCKALQRTIATYHPMKIIETGTYTGLGSTTAIADAIGSEVDFVSIEIDPSRVEIARRNLEGKNVQVVCGISIPRSLLPSPEAICQKAMRLGIPVDMPETGEPWDFYTEEVGFSAVPEDVLGDTLRRFGGKVDLVLLDSAGHMGFAEFEYLLDQVRSDFVLALDDIAHVKHYKSFQAILASSNFKVLERGYERNSHVIAAYSYKVCA